VTRKSFFACLLGVFSAFEVTAQQPANGNTANQQASPPDEAEPPEEDESVKPKIYPLDPLEAERNIRVGNFYMRQGKTNGYRAAAGRFEDATKYNPNSAEAFFKLGEAEEKLRNKDKAKIAFQRVIRISPDSKLAKEARKKLAGI
jgi:tetratricopeptide (TPR) repeat protein